MLNQHLQAAQGYFNLGMVDEASEELDAVGADSQKRPEVLQLRLLILMKRKLWDVAIDVARSLCRSLEDMPDPYLHLAFCLHELHRTEEARQCLLQGPDTLQQVPTYYYNMACYEAQLGNVDKARTILEIAVKMNPDYRECALRDPDLRALHSKTG